MTEQEKEGIETVEESTVDESVDDAPEVSAEDTSSADDTVTPLEETPVEDSPLADQNEPEAQDAPATATERTFTQEQVDKIAGKSREEGRKKGYEQARKEFLEKYGVDSDDEFDDLYSKGSRFDELSARYDDRDGLLKQAQTELALVKSGIDPMRYDDVKAILSSKGLEVSEETISSLLPTHPEWKGTPKESLTPAPSIPQPNSDGRPLDRVGTIPLPPSDDSENREKEEAKRLYGLSKI